MIARSRFSIGGSARRRGFTSLVETAVSVALVGLLVAPLVWTMVKAFRMEHVTSDQMDTYNRMLGLLRAVSGDVVASGGLLEFTTADGTTRDGLVMHDRTLVVLERRSDGSVFRSIYGPAPHPQLKDERIATRTSDFQIVNLGAAVQIVVQMDKEMNVGASLLGAPRREPYRLTTAVVPDGW